MTLFDDREKAYEAKFRQDQETAFKIMVRRDKLLGLWAAERLGLVDDEATAYAKSLIAAELGAGAHDIGHSVLADLEARGVAIEAAEVTRQLLHLHEIAREQILAEITGRPL